jgi:hypothetical protein
MVCAARIAAVPRDRRPAAQSAPADVQTSSLSAVRFPPIRFDLRERQRFRAQQPGHARSLPSPLRILVQHLTGGASEKAAGSTPSAAPSSRCQPPWPMPLGASHTLVWPAVTDRPHRPCPSPRPPQEHRGAGEILRASPGPARQPHFRPASSRPARPDRFPAPGPPSGRPSPRPASPGRLPPTRPASPLHAADRFASAAPFRKTQAAAIDPAQTIRDQPPIASPMPYDGSTMFSDANQMVVSFSPPGRRDGCRRAARRDQAVESGEARRWSPRPRRPHQERILRFHDSSPPAAGSSRPIASSPRPVAMTAEGPGCRASSGLPSAERDLRRLPSKTRTS